jgi:V4R domain
MSPSISVLDKGHQTVSERSSSGGPSLKGRFFQVRFEYVREYYGYDALAQVMAALPAEERRLLQGLDRDAWYPFRSLNVLDRCIASQLAPDDPGLFERLGAVSARHRADLLGEHARLVNVHGFLSRLADEHDQFATFGRVQYRRLGFTEGEIRASGFPEVDEVYCRGSRGYLRAAVELLTGGPVEVHETACQCRGQPFCIYRLKWPRAEGAEPSS